MKKHEILAWIGLALGGIPLLLWVLVFGDDVSLTAGLAMVGCMLAGGFLAMYAQSINPRLHFMYKGSFVRTLLMTLAVIGVGWLLTLGVYSAFRVITSM